VRAKPTGVQTNVAPAQGRNVRSVAGELNVHIVAYARKPLLDERASGSEMPVGAYNAVENTSSTQARAVFRVGRRGAALRRSGGLEHDGRREVYGGRGWPLWQLRVRQPVVSSRIVTAGRDARARISTDASVSWPGPLGELNRSGVVVDSVV